MIRGLALRSLCSLRLTTVIEYIVDPLQKALSDPSGYVRRAGVLGILKVHHMAPDIVKESDYVNRLYDLLRDRDPQVMINCIHALNEIMIDEGGMGINSKIVQHLLNRILEFNEWGQCAVLSLVSRYKAETQEETSPSTLDDGVGM